MDTGQRLARAVLLFSEWAPWTPDKQVEWTELTGRHEATTKVLCDLARSVLNAEVEHRERAEREAAEDEQRRRERVRQQADDLARQMGWKP